MFGISIGGLSPDGVRASSEGRAVVEGLGNCAGIMTRARVLHQRSLDGIWPMNICESTLTSCVGVFVLCFLISRRLCYLPGGRQICHMKNDYRTCRDLIAILGETLGLKML